MKTQTRGPITDRWPVEGDIAECECVHGKVWPEGDRFEPEGKACAECVQQWFRERPEWMAA